jgi:hypothetical protein
VWAVHTLAQNACLHIQGFTVNGTGLGVAPLRFERHRKVVGAPVRSVKAELAHVLAHLAGIQSDGQFRTAECPGALVRVPSLAPLASRGTLPPPRQSASGCHVPSAARHCWPNGGFCPHEGHMPGVRLNALPWVEHVEGRTEGGGYNNIYV